MALSKHDEELVAVAVAVAAGCRPCTSFHLAAARDAGAGEAEIEKAVAGAMCVRNSAAEGMRRHALGLPPAKDGCGCATTTPLEELVAIGASLAVHCTENLGKHLAAAAALGVPKDDLDRVSLIVERIRDEAIGNIEARFRGPKERRSSTSCGAAASCG